MTRGDEVSVRGVQITPAQINARNARFWNSGRRRLAGLLGHGHVAPEVFADIGRQCLAIGRARSPEEQLALLRGQLPLEAQLERAYADLGHRPFFRAQRERAGRPRVDLDDGRTMSEIISDLARDPNHQGKSTKAIWPILQSVLANLGLNPREEFCSSDFRKSACVYDFGARDRRITYGRFANAVSDCRRQKSR